MIPDMGARTDTFPPTRGLTDSDRIALARESLSTGMMARVREVSGWTHADLARCLEVTPGAVIGWESGRSTPGDHDALRLWEVMVRLCRTPAVA
jgi:DNA-binding transcriptional regulator YiaG